MWDDERLQDWGILERYTHEIRYDKYDSLAPESHSDTDSCPSPGRDFYSEIEEEEKETERGWGDPTSPLTPDSGDNKMTQVSKAQDWGNFSCTSEGRFCDLATSSSYQQISSNMAMCGKRVKSRKPVSKNVRERSYWGLYSFQISDKLGNLKLKHAQKRSHSAPPGPRRDNLSISSDDGWRKPRLYEFKDGSYRPCPEMSRGPFESRKAFDELAVKQVLMSMSNSYEMV